MIHIKQRAIGQRVRIKFILSLIAVVVGFAPFGLTLLQAEEPQRHPPDRAGQEAFRIWAQRERDRTMAEAARRYWDYWLSKPSRRFSAHRLWLELEQTQRWLKDPDRHAPPPPPPLPGYGGHYHSYYPYPYYYPYYPPPYHWPPPMAPPLYYSYPPPYETYKSGGE
jgi:hypothetical protein